VGVTNLIAALLALCLAHPAWDIGGDSACPAPDEVRDRLAQIFEVTAKKPMTESDRHRANLSSIGGKVHVELLGPDGRLLAERTLDKTGSCADVAEAVAVVLSTWEAKFNLQVATSVVLPRAVPVCEEPLPEVIEKVFGPKTSLPTSLPSSLPHLRFDLGLALLGSIAGGEVVPGAKVEGSLFPATGRLGLGVSLSAISSHSQSVEWATGTAHWMRAALTAGPRYRLGGATRLLDWYAGGAISLLHVEGVGLPASATDTSAQFGLGAGLRGMWAWNNAAAWPGTAVLVFPGQCSQTNPANGMATIVDCGKLNLCLAVRTCVCSTTSCVVTPNFGPELSFDIAITNNDASGSVTGSVGDRNVHFTRDQ
jgi:hypothetical protein